MENDFQWFFIFLNFVNIYIYNRVKDTRILWQVATPKIYDFSYISSHIFNIILVKFYFSAKQCNNRHIQVMEVIRPTDLNTSITLIQLSTLYITANIYRRNISGQRTANTHTHLQPAILVNCLCACFVTT